MIAVVMLPARWTPSLKALPVMEQLVIDSSNVLGEPFRRNTAPCLAYGTFRILKENPEAIIAVTPSDHLIVKEDKLQII